MKLFKLDVVSEKRHEGREVIRDCVELPAGVSKRFIVANFDWELLPVR